MQHEFVESVPSVSKMLPDTLYISIKYNAAIHLCACGCGSEIVTPISPAGWKLIYDGQSVSLHPSIGNWNYPCRSHYFITKSQVRWAGSFTDEQISRVRRADENGVENLDNGKFSVGLWSLDAAIGRFKLYWRRLVHNK